MDSTTSTDHIAEQKVHFGAAFRSLHGSSYPLLIMFLCAPFIQPVSLGPLATVGGFALVALGYQIIQGRDSPWLPNKIEQLTLSLTTWQKVEGIVNWVLTTLQKFTKTRLTYLVAGAKGRVIVGGLVILAGLLMAIPFIGVPFNNALPALMALSAAFALLEDDGLFVLFSLFWMVASVAYFAFIFWIIYTLGFEAVLPYLQEHFF